MPRPGDPRPWIKKAEDDYEAAMALSRRRARPLPGVVCFHAQQCAEKYLKALLVRARVAFPRTHDLLSLLGLLSPAYPGLRSLGAPLARLLPYSVDTRYPGAAMTRRQANVAVKDMREVRRVVRSFLRLP